jgi:hypothetical protein
MRTQIFKNPSPTNEMRRGYSRMLTCIMIFSTSLMLSACGKTVEFTEEVQLFESDKKVILERREVYEPRITGLDFRQTYIRSELSIVGSKMPSWKERLHPIYFGEFPAGAGYFLVATIPDSIGCYQRGKPSSPYVVFTAEEQGWREIPLPKYLDGRAANLLLGVERNLSESKLVTKGQAEEKNRRGAFSPDDKKINLSARFGC